MNRKTILCLVLISIAGNLLSQNNIKAFVVRRIPLPDISSASGISFLNGKYYVIGDDMPWLFELDDHYVLIRKIKIFDDKIAVNGRIPKTIKPDLESITNIKWGKDTDLLIFGSGSASYREKAFKIDFDKNKTHVKEFDLSALYHHMRKKASLTSETFNIEGAEVWKKNIILLNRGMNNMFIVHSKDFDNIMEPEKKEKINIKIYSYHLPEIQGNNACFSGCTIIQDEDLLIFTASVENTPDWISDGEILGSYIGFIDLHESQNNTPVCIPIMEKNHKILDKIESVVNIDKSENTLKFIAVTDNDNGRSDLLEIEVQK